MGSFLEDYNHFQKAGLRATRQNFKVGERSYFNVSTLWGDPKLPRLVIGAHYDVEGEKPGADDNASGVALGIATLYLLN